MTILTIAVAFLAGIVSFASPCCLPMVPAYVSYIVGTTPADSPNARRVAFKQSLAFVLGFTIVFVGLWVSLGLVGYLLRDYIPILRVVGAPSVKDYADRVGLTCPKVADPDTRIASAYRVYGIPAHFFIDKSGILRSIKTGGLSPEQMAAALTEISR